MIRCRSISSSPFTVVCLSPFPAVTLTAQAFRLGVPADVLEVFTGVER